MTSDATRKVIVVEESLLRHDPTAILNFGNNVVVIPWPSLEGLDHQMRNGINGNAAAARQALKILDGLRNGNDLSKGVPTPQGGFLLVEKGYYFPKDIRIDIRESDNFTIGVALKWGNHRELFADQKGTKDPFLKFGRLGKVVIVTKNPALRIKAAACDIATEDYLNDRVIQKPEELYSGIARIEVSDDAFRTLGGLLYHGGVSTPRLPREEVGNVVKLPELLSNQCCVFVSEGEEKELLTLYKSNIGDEPYFRGVSKARPSNGHVHPRNTEQTLAYALLTDPETTLVVLSGIAGGGKSLMALLAGQEQGGRTNANAIYQQTCVCRSNWEMGKSLGYLKGDLKEKWEPWARPVLDLLELLRVKIDDLEGMINGTNPDIQILPINFIQGRSLNKRFMILDEAQNFTRDEVKAFITRAGAGTKVVLTGDIGQIVNPYLDPFSCGLSHVIQRMQGKDYFGCLNLKISERSTLAQQAADLL
jgi:PhoH-like ATPase